MLRCTSSSSWRFFATLQKYLTSASSRSSQKSHLSRRLSTPQAQRCQTTLSKPRKESLRPQTHYDLFPETIPAGPPPEGPFVVNLRQLRKEFLQLQAQAHPDRHQGPDKARAEGASARINDAYKTLQNPLLRAQYLLTMRGINLAEDETAKVEDPELLMEVLEMRESIEAAEVATDLESMQQNIDEKIEGSLGILEKAFEADDIDDAKEEAVKLRYWINIQDSLKSWEKGKPVVMMH